jgi:hypothetical protein
VRLERRVPRLDGERDRVLLLQDDGDRDRVVVPGADVECTDTRLDAIDVDVSIAGCAE